MDAADGAAPWPLLERHADSGWSDCLLDIHAVSVLSPEMLDTPRRIDADGHGSDLLEVVALCLHVKEPALLTVAVGDWAWPITVYPEHGLYRAPIDWSHAPPQGLARAQLLGCEAALQTPPRLGGRQRTPPPNHYPLAGLTWTPALLGPRSTPLRTLARTDRFRATTHATAHDLAAPGWRLPGALGSAVARLAGTPAHAHSDFKRALQRPTGAWVGGRCRPGWLGTGEQAAAPLSCRDSASQPRRFG